MATTRKKVKPVAKRRPVKRPPAGPQWVNRDVRFDRWVDKISSGNVMARLREAYGAMRAIDELLRDMEADGAVRLPFRGYEAARKQLGEVLK